METPVKNHPWVYSIGEPVHYTPISKNQGKVRVRFRNSKGDNIYIVETEFVDEFVIRSEAQLSRSIVHAGLGNTPKCKGFFPPEGGFKREHWYIAEVAYSMGNPIHEVLLYAGLCDDGDARPGNYTYLAGLNYRLDEPESLISRPVYLRVVKDLGVLATER